MFSLSIARLFSKRFIIKNIDIELWYLLILFHTTSATANLYEIILQKELQ